MVIKVMNILPADIKQESNFNSFKVKVNNYHK